MKKYENLGLKILRSKRMFTNKDTNFFKINSDGIHRFATLKLFPGGDYGTANLIDIPTTEGYGLMLRFKDDNGNEIPDKTKIELRKEKEVEKSSEKIGDELEYIKFKTGRITSLNNPIKLYKGETFVIYVEEKYAQKIPDQNIDFAFVVDLYAKGVVPSFNQKTA